MENPYHLLWKNNSTDFPRKWKWFSTNPGRFIPGNREFIGNRPGPNDTVFRQSDC